MTELEKRNFTTPGVFSIKEFEVLQRDPEFVARIGGYTTTSLYNLQHGLDLPAGFFRIPTYAQARDVEHNISLHQDVFEAVFAEQLQKTLHYPNSLIENREYKAALVTEMVREFGRKDITLTSRDRARIYSTIEPIYFEYMEHVDRYEAYGPERQTELWEDLVTAAELDEEETRQLRPAVTRYFGSVAQFLTALNTFYIEDRQGVQIIFDKSGLTRWLSTTKEKNPGRLRKLVGEEVEITGTLIPADCILCIIPLGGYEERALLPKSIDNR